MQLETSLVQIFCPDGFVSVLLILYRNIVYSTCFKALSISTLADSSELANGDTTELLIQNIFKRYRTRKPTEHLARRSDVTDFLMPTSAPETPNHNRPSSFPNFYAR